MRKVTVRFQGLDFTFAIHSRAQGWVKVKVIRHGQTVDYVYAKDGTAMRAVANKWLQGAA